MPPPDGAGQDRLPSPLEVGHHLVCPRPLRRPVERGGVEAQPHRPEPDVLGGRCLEADVVLEQHRHLGTPGVGVEVGQVDAVDGDAPPVRGVQAGEQLDQRGLPGAVGTDDGQALTGRDLEVEPGKDRAGGARVREVDRLEAQHPGGEVGGAQAAAGRRRIQSRPALQRQQRVQRGGTVGDGRLAAPEVQIERLADSADEDHHPLERQVPAHPREPDHRQPDGDTDPEPSEHGDEPAPALAPLPPRGGHRLLPHRPEPLADPTGQAEDTGLLGRRRGEGQVAEVHRTAQVGPLAGEGGGVGEEVAQHDERPHRPRHEEHPRQRQGERGHHPRRAQHRQPGRDGLRQARHRRTGGEHSRGEVPDQGHGARGLGLLQVGDPRRAQAPRHRPLSEVPVEAARHVAGEDAGCLSHHLLGKVQASDDGYCPQQRGPRRRVKPRADYGRGRSHQTPRRHHQSDGQRRARRRKKDEGSGTHAAYRGQQPDGGQQACPHPLPAAVRTHPATPIDAGEQRPHDKRV